MIPARQVIATAGFIPTLKSPGGGVGEGGVLAVAKIRGDNPLSITDSDQDTQIILT